MQEFLIQVANSQTKKNQYHLQEQTKIKYYVYIKKTAKYLKT